MDNEKLLYEGKAKQIYATDKDDRVLIKYKDSITAFNGGKKDEIYEKGYYNNQISCLLFKILTEKGVSNHFIKQVSETETLAKKVSIIPIEVVVRNITAGSLAKRLGIDEGIVLEKPIIEFYYKNDDLQDPLITEEHIRILNIASDTQISILKKLAVEVNSILKSIFINGNMILVDFKLEFGLTSDKKIILADEISPDTCRIWDTNTNKSLDKDIYRKNLGNIIEAYDEVYKRLEKVGEKCTR